MDFLIFGGLAGILSLAVTTAAGIFLAIMLVLYVRGGARHSHQAFPKAGFSIVLGAWLLAQALLSAGVALSDRSADTYSESDRTGEVTRSALLELPGTEGELVTLHPDGGFQVRTERDGKELTLITPTISKNPGANEVITTVDSTPAGGMRFAWERLFVCETSHVANIPTSVPEIDAVIEGEPAVVEEPVEEAPEPEEPSEETPGA